MHHQDRHGNLLQVFGEVRLGERRVAQLLLCLLLGVRCTLRDDTTSQGAEALP